MIQIRKRAGISCDHDAAVDWLDFCFQKMFYVASNRFVLVFWSTLSASYILVEQCKNFIDNVSVSQFN